MRATRDPRPRKRRGEHPSWVIATLVLVLSCLMGMALPRDARAVTSPFPAVTIDEIAEDEFEDPGYAWSIGFEESQVIEGFSREENIGQYLSAGGHVSEGFRNEYVGTPGYAAFIDGNTEKGSFSLRYTGGSYEGTPIDAIVTLEDWTYREPPGGFSSIPQYGGESSYWETFRPGVYIADEWHTLADSGEGIDSWNFYTLGLDELVVSVRFVHAGTSDPVEMMGHLTTTDLDVYQRFSFGGACTRGKIAADNDVLEIVDNGTTVDSGAHWLDDQEPVDYRNGLVEAYFDTTGDRADEPLLFWFGTSWGAGDTAESVFFLNTEYITSPPPNDEPTEIVKSADKTGEDRISIDDEVEYTIDYTAHEQGFNCRWGYHYTALDLVDVLPAEMRYVDGSGRLYDSTGADVTERAGTVIYEGDNENPTENTVRFEFEADYLQQMPMEGEHYRFVFRAVLTEYPANGYLFVTNGSYALINRTEKNHSNEVVTNLLEPVLTVDKGADAYEYEVGDVVSYRVAYLQTVENAQARQTIVSDNLPEFLELLPETVQATGTKDLPPIETSGNEWSLDFDKFNFGDELVVTYQARVRQSGNGEEIVNNAGIHANNAMDADDPEEIWANTAKVEVTKDVDRYEGYVGPSDEDPGFFEYAVTLRNTQAGTVANGVVLTDDSLPEGMRLGRNDDGSLMITSVRENDAEVQMNKDQDRYSGSLSDIQYRVGEAADQDPHEGDFEHDQTAAVTPQWSISPKGTGWKMTIDHLASGHDIKVVYRAYPEGSVSGWEIENRAEVTADNSQPDDDIAVVWVNQPHFAIDKQASNDRFQVNDEILYSVKVTNTTPGTLGRNVVVSDLAHTQGVELLHDTIRVYDTTGRDITDTCTVSYKNNPHDAETFIVETHRDLVAGMTDDVRDLYEQLMACTDEASFDETCAQIRQAVEDDKGADHDSVTEAVPGRPTWRDGAIEWLDGSNPLGIDWENPRMGSLSCETELVVEYRVKINDGELAGQTVDNTALVVSDEPNTSTTDDEVVDVKGPKLVIAKSSDRDLYQVGETARYTLVATQTREDNVAKGVVISDLMDERDVASIVHGSVKATGPDGQPIAVEPEYVSDDSGKIVGFTLATGVDLADEESVTVTYDVTFEKAGTTLHNVAQANATNTVGGTDDNLVSVVDPYATVTLDKSVDRETARFMEWATYTIRAQVADSPAKNVVISDMSLPDSMPIDKDSITVKKDGADVTHDALEWDGNGFSTHLGDLEAGGDVTITYRAQVRDESHMGTSVTNVARLTSDSLDEPLEDDATVRVADEGETVLDKAASVTSAQVGDSIVYAVVATAGADLTEATLSDSGLPGGIAIDPESLRVTVSGEEVMCEPIFEGTDFSVALGDLSAGDVVELAYEAVVESLPEEVEDLTNTASLQSPDLPEPAEDTVVVDVTRDEEEPGDDPEGEPREIIAKEADGEEANVGEDVAYTVSVTPEKDLTNAVVTDSGLPEGTAIDEDSIVVTVAGETLEDVAPSMDGTGFSIELGDLVAGETVEVSYRVTVEDDSLAGTTLENTATLEATELDEPLSSTEEVRVTGEKDKTDETIGPSGPTSGGSGVTASDGGSLPGTGEADPAPLLGVFGAGVAVVGAALRVRHLLRRRH
ncbi:isopeptide-forming domain-containing fimbrial protein [Olsenella sp. An285]|uniref:isopeptide-forming domain-containing fimbrial protein n=1 Tax=Olsenella sp. An285 TaxID=1965621 RepID=UPI00117D87AA|nr:isopeptide-forming domain-containing fimbrial protein [Olsenella sp. An285]